MAVFELKQVMSSSRQSKIATQLGVTQGAISQANSKQRNIFIVENDDGVSAFEIKPVFNTNPNLELISDCLLKKLETT